MVGNYKLCILNGQCKCNVQRALKEVSNNMGNQESENSGECISYFFDPIARIRNSVSRSQDSEGCLR